jgi:hypothetical protein
VESCGVYSAFAKLDNYERSVEHYKSAGEITRLDCMTVEYYGADLGDVADKVRSNTRSGVLCTGLGGLLHIPCFQCLNSAL